MMKFGFTRLGSGGLRRMSAFKSNSGQITDKGSLVNDAGDLRLVNDAGDFALYMD